MNNIGNKLSKAREAAGLTQTELAEKIGVSGQKIISSWETGNATPDIHTFVKLCRVLKVRYEYFFGDIPEDSATEAESILVTEYRSLDARGKCAVWNAIKNETERTRAYRSYSVGHGAVLKHSDMDYERMREKGKNLKERFKESGLSYEDIAAYILTTDYTGDVNVYILSRVINGKKVPTEYIYNVIDEAMRVLSE